MKTGRYNVGVGLLAMAGFMLYGSLLVYLRNFAPNKEAWVASYSVEKHFEARLAHVHGNLFALLNLALGLVLAKPTRHRQRLGTDYSRRAGPRRSTDADRNPGRSLPGLVPGVCAPRRDRDDGVGGLQRRARAALLGAQ